MNRGLTIVETIIYIAVFTMAIMAVSGLLIYFYRTNAYVIEQAFAVESARKGMEIMVREIREATYADTGAYPIGSATSTSFIFFSDVDRDANIEKIRYFLDGTNFKRGETQASGSPLVYDSGNEIVSVISDDVRNGGVPIFSYYNASSTTVGDLSRVADIKMVEVVLIVNILPDRLPDEFTLKSSAQLRNLYGD